MADHISKKYDTSNRYKLVFCFSEHIKIIDDYSKHTKAFKAFIVESINYIRIECRNSLHIPSKEYNAVISIVSAR